MKRPRCLAPLRRVKSRRPWVTTQEGFVMLSFRSSCTFGVCVAALAAEAASPASARFPSQPRLPVVRAARPHHGWVSSHLMQVASTIGLLYVADSNNGVIDIYRPKKSSMLLGQLVPPGGAMVNGLADDAAGNVYVSVQSPPSTAAVIVYPLGKTQPSAEYTAGLLFPFGMAVGPDGTLFVADLAYGIVEYPPGQMTPSQTLSGNNLTTVAVDKANDVFTLAGGGVGGEVTEFPDNSPSGEPFLTAPHQPFGMAIVRLGGFLLTGAANDAGFVDYYPPGFQFPTKQYPVGLIPNAVALNKLENTMYVAGFGVSGNGGVLEEVGFPGGRALFTLSDNAAIYVGVAVYPPAAFAK